MNSRYQTTTQHQPDKLIATYRIFGFCEDDTSTDPTPSSSNPPPELTISNKETITIDSTRYSITSINPRGPCAKNTITIHEPSQRIPNVKNYTHVAHVFFGKWVGNFLCSYDAPAGVLHNARAADMNPAMQKATGWRWQDDAKPLTKKQNLEEQRAVVKYGVHKRPRSKTIALCTLKANDEAGWKYLELRTRSSAVRGKVGSIAVKDRMVSLVARKVVAGGGGAQSTLLGVVIPVASTLGAVAAGDNGKKGDKGAARELEGCETFADLLELLQGRVAAES